MLMRRKRIISENNAQPLNVFFLQHLNKSDDLRDWWALKIGELFERNRSVGVAANVRRAIALCKDALAFGDILELRPFCAIKNRAAAKRCDCDYQDNHKWQVAFHARDERRIFDARTESS